MSNPNDDGKSRRDKALRGHESKHAKKLLVVRHRFAAKLLADGRASLNGLSITDDLKGNYLGSVFRVFRRWISKLGMEPSEEKDNHARAIVLWQVENPDAVRNWIATTLFDDDTDAGSTE